METEIPFENLFKFTDQRDRQVVLYSECTLSEPFEYFIKWRAEKKPNKVTL